MRIAVAALDAAMFAEPCILGSTVAARIGSRRRSSRNGSPSSAIRVKHAEGVVLGGEPAVDVRALRERDRATELDDWQVAHGE